MIGLVLVTHGKLADEFRSALEHVVGVQEAIATICIGPDDNMETRRDDIVAGIRSVESGSGVIVLTDMFGGTPSNLAISAMEPGTIEVIAGLNLPMLVKLASVRRNLGVVDAALAGQDAGRKYINVASALLGAAPQKTTAG
ncbi:PTS sugar transporter subunit IIA [Pararhizobium sp. IMCC21322]|uniref:PTS sugar transporter subunit IIA n=1 Tax=Pararhizobium sp. IMCC21322 TaxID=3067903 RepID=UPI0027425E10|nr:PTS sugar transporter subunit IIA [Pararhizobium sp. IMCC21322]